jgi:DUF4097 and DUF4098 domain-containing protein YvlB
MKRKWWIVGILVLLELVVCAVILMTFWAGWDAFGEVRFFYVADTFVEETLEETFAVDGPAVVDLTSDYGDVTVTGSEGDEVEVVARLILWGEDEEDARRQVDVQMTQRGNRIAIRVVRSDRVYVGFASTRGSRVDFEIRVPAETSLKLLTDHGDLIVDGVTGAMELGTDFGGIEVEEVSGRVDAKSDSGDITLIGVSDGGDIEAETDFGALVLQDITAESLIAHSDGGDIQVENVTLDGALDLETNFGSVTVQDAEAERIQTHSDSGDIQVEDATLDGALDLETNFGDVTANGVRASSYRMVSDSGNLTLNGCSGLLDLRTDFGSIEVRDGTEAALTLKTDSGEIYFSGSLHAEGVHLVETGFGKVHLVLPPDAAFDLDAETDFGSIKTDFAVTVSEFEEKHMVGKVNGGGPLLQIRTDSGSITLVSATVESD